ncbi:ATP-binding protein [Litchfieldia alkalitelluris]|uniref:ATP-binding protein n=1 Tax=Litchfieldia alkalitelluris TaxID=304268 RepID=UPI001F23EC3D|nr:ATP-binding protein [Litchfieldia alkalitelluris]
MYDIWLVHGGIFEKMLALIKPIIVNITILFSLTFNANLFFPFNHSKVHSLKQKIIYGLIGALAAILCMLFPITGLEQTHFDLRMIIILVVTLYSGLVSGSICLVLVVIVRLIIGGNFALIGVLVSLVAFLVALIFRKWYLSTRSILKAVFIIATYLVLYIIILLFSAPFLGVQFYIVYFSGLMLTSFLLIQVIERLIKANQQFHETVYTDKLSTVSQMAASIAHEIRNPITTVRGFIQFLEKDSKDEKLVQFAPLILEELDRTNLIITNYLKISKPSNFKMKRVDLNQILFDSIDLLRPFGTYQNVSLFYNGSGSHFIIGDEDHLKQSIINVIKNGIEAIEDGNGYVKVSKRTSVDNRRVLIEIEDNGKGMNQEQLEKIGLPYYTTKTKGTGLGSMITNRLIREMNGTIEYESKPNKGTIVKITLALSKE